MARPERQPLVELEARLTGPARRQLRRLTDPAAIQRFLDAIPYRSGEAYLSPRRTLLDRQANCFDGALLAATALRRLGWPPLVLQLFAERDDDHIIAVYRRDGRYGALAKSNFVSLRGREAVYRSLRELALSYFEGYFNMLREKALRAYSLPLDLRRFDRLGWMWSDSAGETIVARLDHRRRYPLITPRMAARLSLLDERSFRGLTLGVNPAGVYQPPGVTRAGRGRR